MPVAKPVKFIHEKGPQYRVFHVDGAWGSINVQGNAQLELYVEHAVTPSAVVQPIQPDGIFSGEQIPFGLVDKDHFLVIRDFQCGVVLSYNAAVQVKNVLDSYIATVKDQLDSAIEQIKKTCRLISQSINTPAS